ncbi:MAG: hypothetical protein IKT01_04930 [Eubacteriaceae bacterium]|nr:hypothetical protein [Eubacteriaceae bacterium]
MNNTFPKRQQMLENHDANPFDDPENYDIFPDVKIHGKEEFIMDTS